MNHRSKITAAMLALFLGSIGAHHFYLGKKMEGIIYLAISVAGFFIMKEYQMPVGYLLVGVLSLVDFFYLLAMSPEKFNKEFNEEFNNQ